MPAHAGTYRSRAAVLLGFVGAMWFVHALDEFLPQGFSAAGIGIVPRTFDGLQGILIAPFIHADWEHLIANSIPLLVWGALVLLRGIEEFIFVVLISAATSGVGTWLFGEADTQHIGASGVALGLLGYLLFRAAFDRKISSIVISLAMTIAYATLLAWSLVPEDSISWSGHFFGVIGGFIAARLRYPTVTRDGARVYAFRDKLRGRNAA